MEILIVLVIAIGISIFIALPFFKKNTPEEMYLLKESNQIEDHSMLEVKRLNTEK